MLYFEIVWPPARNRFMGNQVRSLSFLFCFQPVYLVPCDNMEIGLFINRTAT